MSLDRFLQIAQDPYAYLVEWRRSHDKKMIGCAPMHFPEEIVHAAGMLPVVLQESNEPITLGHSHIQTFFCGVVRSLVDIGIKGKLDFLDGVVFSDICLQMRGLERVLTRNCRLAFREGFYQPMVLRRELSRWYLLEEIARFKSSLEAFAGHQIGDGELRRSIKVCNENRALLRRLFELRRSRPGAISATESVAIVTASMLMPKEEHSQLISQLLPKLEARKPARDGVRLVLSGAVCESPRADLLEVIEEVGGVVVDDDLYAGSRYFNQDVALDGDPWQALADRYLNMRLSCPTRVDRHNHWGDQVVEMARRSRAQGVVILMVKYCEPHNFYYPDQKRKLDAAGIPEFLIETEHEIMSLGQLKTRLQAFVEMIGGA